MRKRNPLFLLLLFVTIFALVLSGCGEKETEAPEVEEPGVEEPDVEEPPAEPVEITAWTFTYQPFVDGLNAMADAFNEMQDEVIVKVEVFEWANYWDKIAVAVATDTGPDVFHSYTAFTPKYIAEGVLQPIPEELFPFDEMAPMVSQFRLAGELWAVPMGVRTFAYVYNPDLYAKHPGLEPPTTWEEEIAVAEELTEFDADGNMTVAGEGLYPKWEQYTIWQLRCHQAGGSYISEDLREMTWEDPACIEAFKFATSLMTDYEIFVDGFYNNWDTAQAEGVMGGFIAPSGVLGAFAEMTTPWAVAPVPGGSANDDTIGNFWPMVLTQQAKGDKYDAAVKFLQFVASEEANRMWCRITYDVPALLSVAREDEFANADYGGFVKALEKAVFIFDPAASEVRIGFDQAWDKVVLEGADPETALLEGEANAQQILDDFWAKMDALE